MLELKATYSSSGGRQALNPSGLVASNKQGLLRAPRGKSGEAEEQPREGFGIFGRLGGMSEQIYPRRAILVVV